MCTCVCMHGWICTVIDTTLKTPEYKTIKVVFYTSKEPNDVTNAVFLLGAFLCAFLGATPKQAWQPFQGLDRRWCLPYRDATWVRSPYDLHVRDCWAGLSRAVEHGMFRPLEFDPQEVIPLRPPCPHSPSFSLSTPADTIWDLSIFEQSASGLVVWSCAAGPLPHSLVQLLTRWRAVGAVFLLRRAGQWRLTRPRAWSLLGFSGPA